MAELQKITEGITGREAADIIYNNDEALNTDIIQTEKELQGTIFSGETGYINKNTGNLNTDTTVFTASGFMVLDRSSDLTIKGYDGVTNNAAICYFYDKDYKAVENYVTGETTGGFREITISKNDFPQNAVYYRSTTRIDQIENSYVKPLTISQAIQYAQTKVDKDTFNSYQTNISTELARPYGDYFTIQGYGIRYTDGVPIQNVGYTVTPFIPLNRNSDIVISGYRGAGNVALLAFYDKDQAFISSIFNEVLAGYVKDYQIKKEDFPANAMYIRGTGYNSVECYIKNATIKFLLDKIGGDSFLDLTTLFPDTVFLDRTAARNAIPTPLRKSKLTIKYATTETIVIETSRALDNWANNTNWLDSQINPTVSSEYIYVITDRDDNVLFSIDKNGICRFKSDQVNYFFETDWDYLFAIVDSNDNIVFAIDRFGNIVGVTSGSSDTSFMKNNLTNEADLMQGFNEVTNYGTPQAEYMIKANFKGRISVKGKFINNVNDKNGNTPFITFENDTVVNSLAVKHSLPVQGTDAYESSATPGNTPFARLTSGFTCNNVTHVYDRMQKSASTKQGGRNNICGDKMIMLWFKGQPIIDKAASITSYSNKPPYENNYFTKEELQARSQELANYTGLYIDISNDTFTVGRDYGGVIFTTALKNGDGTYKALPDFYKELVPPTTNDALPHNPIAALSDFYITFVNMSADKTTESILQVGKIYLIGEYKQQLDPNQNGQGHGDDTLPYDYEHDCYPYFVYNKVDAHVHTFDLILNQNSIGVYVNGDKLTEISKTNNLRIGNNQSDLQLFDLEVYKGNYGDAEIMTDPYYLASERTPILLGIICHNPYDTYEGSNHPLGNGGHSITHMYDICQELNVKKYKTINFRELSDWKAGRIKIPPKSAIIISDDNQIPAFWINNFRIRGSYERMGVKLNFAQILDSLLDTPAITPQTMLNLQLAGHGVANHTRWHNEPMWKKPAPTVWIEHTEARLILRDYGMCETVFIHNKAGGQFSPQQDVLDYFGYTVGVGLGNAATDKYTRLTTNSFTINRVNMGDPNKINAI